MMYIYSESKKQKSDTTKFLRGKIENVNTILNLLQIYKRSQNHKLTNSQMEFEKCLGLKYVDSHKALNVKLLKSFK